MTVHKDPIEIRNTRTTDIEGIIELTRIVYSGSDNWSKKQLTSHLRIFPEGQFVAVEKESQRIIGMAAGLIIQWDDYDMNSSWRDFTDAGMFTNHDPAMGRTFYGAEVMVHPEMQGKGIGKRLYAARRELVERLGLERIRAGARLRNYHLYASRMSAEEYVIKLTKGELGDPTLSFQLKQGFRVLAVVPHYLGNDPESLGYAAVIEWLNIKLAEPDDYKWADPRFSGK